MSVEAVPRRERELDEGVVGVVSRIDSCAAAAGTGGVFLS